MTRFRIQVFTVGGLKESFDNYTRVAKGFLGMSSLWMGEDHLVYVRGAGFFFPFSEEYKRYRYGDIQVVSVAKTSRLGGAILLLTGLLTFIGLLTLVAWLASRGDEFGVVAALVLSMLSLGALGCAAGLLRHLVLGPTCVCDIQTSLSQDRLRPLVRYPRTLEVINRLEPLIRESQAGLSLEANGADGDDVSKPVKTRIADSFEVPVSVMISFVGFAVMGVLVLMALHLESLVLTATSMLFLMGSSLILTLALIASVKKPTPESLRSTLWIQLGCLFLLMGSGAVYYLLVATRSPEYTIGLMGPLEAFSAIPSEGGIAGYLVILLLAIAMIISGIVGLVSGNRWKRKIALVASAKENSQTEEGDG